MLSSQNTAFHILLHQHKYENNSILSETAPQRSYHLPTTTPISPAWPYQQKYNLIIISLSSDT